MAMITEIILARHGEAHCNVAGLAGGPIACTGLTRRGSDQVARLARRLRDSHQRGTTIDVLYTSPRLRVRETADIFADALGLPVRVEQGLDGPRHGQADGRSWNDIKTAFGGPPQSNPDRPYAPGSETWNQYLTRATRCLADLTGRHKGQRILIAGHGETIEATFTLFLALPPGTCIRAGFAPDHASITRWHLRCNRFGQDVWLLTAFNDTCHLADGP